MTGIARRRRPRRRSVNFKRLRWVMTREAALLILLDVDLLGLPELAIRRRLAAEDTDRVDKQLRQLLVRYPYARYQPSFQYPPPDTQALAHFLSPRNVSPR